MTQCHDLPFLPRQHGKQVEFRTDWSSSRGRHVFEDVAVDLPTLGAPLLNPHDVLAHALGNRLTGRHLPGPRRQLLLDSGDLG